MAKTEVPILDQEMWDLLVRCVGKIGASMWLIIVTIIVIPAAAFVGIFLAPVWWISERTVPAWLYIWTSANTQSEKK